MKKVRATVNNYNKLIKNGINPLFPVMRLPSDIKYFIIFKDNYFLFKK